MLLFLLCAGIHMVPANALAEESAGPAHSLPVMDSASAVAAPGTSLLDTIDAPRDYISEKIVNFTKSVDQFFGDERYFQENNKSVIQLEVSELIAESGNHTFGFEGKAKLDLPAAEKRFHFVLESNPEKKSSGETKKDQPAAAKADAVPPAESYAASLRYEKTEESLWHFSSDAGIKFQFPLDPFVRSRGSYAIPLGEWRMKVAETLFWFSTIGLGITSQLDLEHVLSAPVLFRSTTATTCFEAPQNCDMRQDLSVYHTLNERTALLYQASVVGVSQPRMRETAYILLARYRYRLHREWIYFEVSPQLSFPRTDDFKLNTLLLLRLEMIFGARQ